MNTGGAGLVSDWGTCDGVGAAEGTVLSQGQLVGAVTRVPCEAGCGLGFLGRPSGEQVGEAVGPAAEGPKCGPQRMGAELCEEGPVTHHRTRPLETSTRSPWRSL